MEDKMKKKIFGMMILALFVLSFGFLSCKQEVSNDTNGTNGGGNSNPFIGTWICNAEGIKFEFDANNFRIKGFDNSIEGFGTYSYLGNNSAELVVSDGSDSGTAIISGDTLTVTMSSATYYCTKQ